MDELSEEDQKKVDELVEDPLFIEYAYMVDDGYQGTFEDYKEWVEEQPEAS